MPMFRTSPFEELIVKATSENNVTEDWGSIMDICDKVVNYEDGQKYFLYTISKRLNHKVPRVVIQSLTVLDACVKNCGKKLHLEVASRHFVAEIQKLFSKMPAPSSDKLKQLLKKWAENEFKEDPELGLIPSLYYKMKSEGVEFPSEPEAEKSTAPPPPALCSNPDAVSSQQEEEDIIKAIALSLNEAPSSDLPVKEEATDSSSLSSASMTEPVKVRAIYDFDAVEENELTIKSGEVVLITDKSNSSWWKGSNHRGAGYIPSNFVTENMDMPLENLDNHKVPEEEQQTLPKQIDDEDDLPAVIDEKQLEITLHCLNDIDPTEDTIDPEELLKLERQCYAMAPLIDEKLQQIDKRCTVLNAVNEELVSSIQLFYELSTNTPEHSNSMLNPHCSINTFESRPLSVPPTHLYDRSQQNNMVKQVSRPSASSSVPPAAMLHHYPISAQNNPTDTAVPALPYGFAPPQAFPPYFYQPVFTEMQAPPIADPATYQVVLATVPEAQPPEQLTVSNVTINQQKSVPVGEDRSNGAIANGDSASSNSAALVNSSTPVVYPTMMLSPEVFANIQNGLAYASYPSYFTVPPSTFTHQQPASSLVTNYAAPIPVGNFGNGITYIPASSSNATFVPTSQVLPASVPPSANVTSSSTITENIPPVPPINLT